MVTASVMKELKEIAHMPKKCELKQKLLNKVIDTSRVRDRYLFKVLLFQSFQ